MSEKPAITYNTLLAHVQTLGIPVLDFVNHLRPYTAEEEIGHGTSMTVYKSLLRRPSLPNPVRVALKIPNQTVKEDSTDEDEFISGMLAAICQEIRILKHFITHPYVITLYGITFQDLKPILVVELANASLSDYLASRMTAGNRVEWKTKGRFCYEVAEGIKALHTVNIVHGDIKAESILLFGNSEENELVPKLSDFGYSSAIASITGSKGTPNFWAPECTPKAPLEMKAYADKSTKDNYSYGLCVWQVATDGGIPYENMDIEDIDEAKHSDRRLLELMNQLPQDTPDSFKKIIIGMTQYKPAKRKDLMKVKRIIISSNTAFNWFSKAEMAFEINMKILPRDMERINPISFRSMRIPSPIKKRLFRTYEVAALKDDVEAAYFLSVCYGSEFGVNFDKTKMISWAIQAAKGGNLEAVKNIATSYIFAADQLLENFSQLFPWILQIAEYGHKESQLFIYMCYMKGLCVEKNAFKQKEWKMKYLGNRTHSKVCLPEESPLHSAACDGYIGAIRFFIQQEGMDVNAKNSVGITPLHLATFNSRSDAINTLVEEFGADMNIKDINGWTPVHIAADKGNNSILKILVIKFGALANARANHEITPLHVTSQRGHVDTLRFLVSECGADINAKDKCGWTPLHMAAKNGHVGAVRLLLAELGADINTRCDYGRTPLHLAALSGHINIVKLLVAEFGVDVDIKSDYSGWTPLHSAARNGQIDTVKLLVDELGADINASGCLGLTPLVCSGGEKCKEVAQALSEHPRANIHMKNEVGQTLLHLAVKSRQEIVVKILIEQFHLDIYAKDSREQTPLDLADDSPIHFDVCCDGCGERPIIGERYKCTVCEDFDFCNACYSTVNHFDGEHIFISVELPSVKYLLVP